MSADSSIVMYSSRFCPFCFRAKALLEKKGARFEELIVDNDPALRQKMMQDSGRRTVPQIWLGNHHVGGCDDLFALEAKGELDTMLAAL